MKKIFILASFSISIFSSCNSSKSTELKIEEGSIVADKQEYACSMDPDIKGKKGDKCSKCGMELTELAAVKVDTIHSK
jgi:Heavy metal binding domain